MKQTPKTSIPRISVFVKGRPLPKGMSPGIVGLFVRVRPREVAPSEAGAQGD